MHAVPVAPSARAGGVPPKLEAVILRCLSKQPEERFGDAAALCAALDACDDVPLWTRANALAWWRARQAPPVSRRETSALLTVNLQSRARHS